MAGYILLIDHNENDEQLIRRAFQQNGVNNTVLVARDGAQAMDILFTREVLPSIVLLDPDIPRISGNEIVRLMKEEPRTAMIPVVTLTKPIGLADYIDAVKKAIGGLRPTRPEAVS